MVHPGSPFLRCFPMLSLVAAVMLVMQSACLKSPSEPTAQEPASITLSSYSIVLTAIGQRVLINATVLDQDSRVIANATVFFRISNVDIATVSENGLVTAVSMGTTQVTVTSGYATASATITVEQQSGSITITPTSATLTMVGQTVQLMAEVKDTGNTVIPGAPVSWSSSNPEFATVDANGLVTAVASGTTQITATSGGVSTSRPVFVVLAPPAARIELNISEATLTSIGQSLQLDALVYDIDGVAIPGAMVSWSSSHPEVATVSEIGLVSAVANGTTLVTATSGGVSTFATIHVVIEGTVPPPVASSDRDVLEAFYYATNGPNWTNSTNWLTGATLAQWYGVTANDDDRVTELTITSNNLEGSLPSTLGDLEYLEVLNLELNRDLSGNVPEELGDLSNLTFLKFSATDLSGPIPSSLGRLSNLRTLHLNHTDLSGSIPTELGDLTELTSLDLCHSDLSGTIPSELGNLSSVTWFCLGANGFTGPLPTSLVGLSSVQYFHVGMNELSGTIPSELGDLGNLQELLLFTNEFTGDFPVSLANLTELWRLSIAGNDLTGCIPPVLHTRLTLTDIDALGLPDCSTDRDALVALYNTTNGPSWTNNSRWLSDRPIDEWHGVTTNNDGRVTELTITSNNLDGTLPSSLGDLEYLEVLNLELNRDLSGNVPEELGNLSNLTFLKFSATGLSGPIPASLGGLSNLRTLHLNYTDLSGSIPSELGNLTELIELDLCSNELSGSIPSELGNLSSVTWFCLGANGFTGTLPTSLVGLSSVQYFHVGMNELSGTIPSELGDLGNLQELLLFTNEFTGDFPVSLANLTELWRLSIAGNDLTGCIPPVLHTRLTLTDIDALGLPDCSADRDVLVALYNATNGQGWTNSTNWLSEEPIGTWHGVTTNDDGRVTELKIISNDLDGTVPSRLGDLEFLTHLDLELNDDLGGSIPEELGNLSNLTFLKFSATGLSGPIPASLGGLSNLGTLHLNYTDLSGPIPLELGNLTELTELDLCSNELSGSIPPELGNLTKVTWFCLGANRFTGTIPSGLSGLSSVTYFHVGSNMLTGSIPVWLGNLTNLEKILLHDNNLTGSIPPELVGLPDLQRLTLGRNELTGCIPTGLREKLNQESNEQLDSLMLPGCEESVPASITITPTSARLTWIGETKQLNAVVYNSADDPIEEAPVMWSSSDPAIASVSGSGLVTAVSNGNTRITAKSGDVSESAGITVSQVARKITVTPSSATLTMAGETEQLNAAVYDDGGTRIRGASVDWSSNNSGVATVSGSGRVTAVSNGTARITARSGSVSDYATITVEIESGDRDVLVALYRATNGQSWTNKNNWMSEEPIGTWHGVTTNGDGRVTGLTITSNNLDGTLPSSLGDLEFLTRLNLDQNRSLSGSIPRSLGDLSNLTFLKLSATGLTGSIPGSLGGLSNLRTLELNDAKLSGSIPSQLGNLTSVTNFHIGHNRLSGSIPSQLGNLSSATYFHVGANQLTETLPNLSGLSSVTYFHVGENMLIGTIPSWLGNLRTVGTLLLFKNKFTGAFPTSLENLPNLTRLSIADNVLTGCIPSSLRTLPTNDVDHLNLPDCQ